MWSLVSGSKPKLRSKSEPRSNSEFKPIPQIAVFKTAVPRMHACWKSLDTIYVPCLWIFRSVLLVLIKCIFLKYLNLHLESEFIYYNFCKLLMFINASLISNSVHENFGMALLNLFNNKRLPPCLKRYAAFSIDN